MALRSSKQALREVAVLLNTDPAGARVYLRRIQEIVGPVPYTTIAEAMQRIEGRTVAEVAAAIKANPPASG